MLLICLNVKIQNLSQKANGDKLKFRYNLNEN